MSYLTTDCTNMENCQSKDNKTVAEPDEIKTVVQNSLFEISPHDNARKLPSAWDSIDKDKFIGNTKESIDVDSSDGHEDCTMNANEATNIQVLNKIKVRPTKCKRTYRDISKLDENVREVALRLEKRCECQEQNCFDGFDAESVYKHRLNIDELSKLEHDMYLMGITMACMESPDETNRHKERKRLRAKYRFKVRN